MPAKIPHLLRAPVTLGLMVILVLAASISLLFLRTHHEFRGIYTRGPKVSELVLDASSERTPILVNLQHAQLSKEQVEYFWGSSFDRGLTVQYRVAFTGDTSTSNGPHSNSSPLRVLYLDKVIRMEPIPETIRAFDPQRPNQPMHSDGAATAAPPVMAGR